uniref:Cyclic nucleotide-binding domain-containing protein n=1 Tax=Hanusia phi TaxID=3032 RepID=A0A7S0EIX8_9CRYP
MQATHRSPRTVSKKTVAKILAWSNISSRRVLPERFGSDVSLKDEGYFEVGSTRLPKRVVEALYIFLERARQRIKAKRKSSRRKYIFLPDGKFRVFWDVVTMTLLLYTLFEIPFHLAFLTDDTNCALNALGACNLVVDLIFCSDMVVSFNTAYMIAPKGEEELVDDHGLIAKHYLQSWFFVDLLSSIPFDRILCLILNGQQNLSFVRTLKTVRFIKLARLLRFMRVLKKWEGLSASPSLSNFLRLFKLIIGLLMCAHIMGCFWRIVIEIADCGTWETPEDAVLQGIDVVYGCQCSYSARDELEKIGLICLPWNWMYKYDAQLYLVGSNASQYLVSVYFTIIGLSTVGFGDITPANDYERAFSTLLTLFGAVIFAFVIGSIGEIAQQGNQMDVELRKSLHSLSDFMQYKNIPLWLQKRVKRHLSYSSSRSPQLYTHDLLHMLPRHLRNSIMQHMCENSAWMIPFFNNMDQELRTHMFMLLRPVLILESEHLYQALDVGEEMYFVLEGELQSVQSRMKDVRKVMETFVRGDCVGEAAILNENPVFRMTSVIAIKRSELLELRKCDVVNVIKPLYPDVYLSLTELSKARLLKEQAFDVQVQMRARSLKRCADPRLKKDTIICANFLEANSDEAREEERAHRSILRSGSSTAASPPSLRRLPSVLKPLDGCNGLIIPEHEETQHQSAKLASPLHGPSDVAAALKEISQKLERLQAAVDSSLSSDILKYYST